MRAIGLLRPAVSTDRRVDENLIRNLAAVRRYDLVGILEISPGTFLPTALTVQTALKHRAAAVIAPTLAHLGGAEHVVALVCDVVTPRQTIRRTSSAPRG